jgi:hypothetical protein
MSEHCMPSSTEKRIQKSLGLEVDLQKDLNHHGRLTRFPL